MSSPKQRIRLLKSEIENLNKQMTITNISKPNLNLPLHSVLKQDQEREEMHQKIISISSKEETLYSQQKDVQTRLKDLAIKKRTELSNSKQTRLIYKTKIEKLKQALQKYNDEFQILSVSQVKKQKIRDNSVLARTKAYEETLIPLEADSQELLNVKQVLDHKSDKLQEKLLREENIFCMCVADAEAKIYQRSENIMFREQIEAHLEEFQKEYFDEFEYLSQSDDYFKQISTLIDLQSKYTEEIIKLDCNLMANSAFLYKLQARAAEIDEEIENIAFNYADLKILSKIKKLEFLINQKCTENGIEKLENTILELNSVEKFDIDEEILKLQLSKVKDFESDLRKDLEWEEKYFSELIAVKNYEKNPIEDIESTFIKNKKVLINRLAAISQWREEVEDIIYNKKTGLGTLVKDKTIIEEFFGFLSKVSNTESRREIESLLNSYIAKINSREKTIQNSHWELKQKVEEKLIVLDSLNKSKEETSSIKIEIIKIKKHLQAAIEKEQILKTESKYRKKNLLSDYLISIKKNLNFYENCVYFLTKSIELLRTISNESQDQIKSHRKSMSFLKFSIKEVEEDLQVKNYQIEKIMEKKQKNKTFTNFTEPDENQLSILSFQMDEAYLELEELTKVQNDFENEYQSKLSMIEQEESILRNQQQIIEADLKNLKIEAKRIKEMEIHLGRPEDPETAPTSETFKDQSRSKSASRFMNQASRDNLYTSELIDGDEVSIPQGNSKLELVVKPFGRQGLASIPISSQPRIASKKYYRFNIEGTTHTDRSFLSKIMPLLEGDQLYKKINSKLSGKTKKFDCLEVSKVHPESCGYSLRQFRLHKSLKRIDVKQPLKPGFETEVTTDNLLAPILSATTLAILRFQNHLNNDDLEYDRVNKKIKKAVKYDINSQSFQIKCRDCAYYPFSIALTQGDKIKLIAKGYQTFKQWINGINALVKYKKLIPKLYSRIESYTSV